MAVPGVTGTAWPPAGAPGPLEARLSGGRLRAPARRGAVRAGAALLAAMLLTLVAPATARADSVRASQWGLETLHVREAWQRTKGEGITVAVLDTGVDARHPDLAGSVLEGTDLVGFGASRGDRPWARHGTAMAGIIAGHGHGDGGGSGVVGIAPEARILPVRVILEEADPARKKARQKRGNALAQGIRWAADHGADVINLSLGDDSAAAHADAGEDEAVQYALGKGVVVVASAGNGGEEGDHVSYPAAYPGVIVATAVDRYGKRATFSTRRWYATVAAPGEGIMMADPDRRYYKGEGTSAASAHVSGVVALLRAEYPDLAPAQIKRLLERTARRDDAGGGASDERDDSLGFGTVDPVAALDEAADLRPTRLTPAKARSAHFGPGPDKGGAADFAARWAGPAAATVGLLLAAAAVALRQGRRRER